MLQLLNTGEYITCPTFDEPGNFHFELYCEDCDVQRLSRLNLGEVDDLFGQGRVTHNHRDAYRWTWALLSPAGSNAHWRSQPYVTDPDVRRIARKLLRIRGVEIPTGLLDDISAAVVDIPTQLGLGEAS